jgi:excisionase family DNA binding protein
MLDINEASKFLGVSKSALRRWEDEGKITSYRTEGNHRRYDKNELLSFKNNNFKNNNDNKYTLAYCRVSSNDQKEDLVRQVENVTNYCIAKGYSFKVVTDIGSGLNYNKKGFKELINLICSNEIDKIVINYKDRLIRFGYEIIEQLCLIHNVKIEIINLTENKSYEEELVEDVLSIITVFSAKLYGSRSHKNKKIINTNKILFKEGIKENDL